MSKTYFIDIDVQGTLQIWTRLERMYPVHLPHARLDTEYIGNWLHPDRKQLLLF